MDNHHNHNDLFKGEIIFLGTGTSEGVPRFSCASDPHSQCKTCKTSLIPKNKNRRRNTSLLVRIPTKTESGIQIKNVLIDIGKFFWHSALEWMVEYGIREIDAVIISHDHFDAIGGLDDLRDWTRNIKKSPMPVYIRERDYKTVSQMFPYMIKKDGIPERALPEIDFKVLNDDFVDLELFGLKFTSLPVIHGPDYICLGFKFGEKESVCYCSDVSEIPESTRPNINNCSLLILDTLSPAPPKYFSHFILEQSLAEVRLIQPHKTLLVGMNHLFEHDFHNEELRKLMAENIDIQLAFDGMRIPINFQ